MDGPYGQLFDIITKRYIFGHHNPILVNCEAFQVMNVHFKLSYAAYCLLETFDRYTNNIEAQSLLLQKKLNRYSPISLTADVVFYPLLYLIICYH